MRYLVWGTGAYCQDKIQYNFQKTEDEVLCFIDRKKGCFWGKEVILPSEILQYQFDKIAIFSSHFLEIAKELIQMGIKSEHIIPGIVFSPYRGSEIQFMTDISSVNVMENGNLDYKYKDKHITIACDKDWIKVKEMFCSEENVELVKNININPVSRLFGIDRGTPIDRYYIESFLKNNSEHIKGNVLEMGEDKYTQQYGDKNCNSFVFMFGEEKGVEGGFVYGDLEKGENLPKEFFDCIIFTQVFNFIYDGNLSFDIVITGLIPAVLTAVPVISLEKFLHKSGYDGFKSDMLPPHKL